MRVWTFATVLGSIKVRATSSVALMAGKEQLTSASMVSVFTRLISYSLALGQDIENVSKHDVEVDKCVCFWDDW